MRRFLKIYFLQVSLINTGETTIHVLDIKNFSSKQCKVFLKFDVFMSVVITMSNHTFRKNLSKIYSLDKIFGQATYINYVFNTLAVRQN